MSQTVSFIVNPSECVNALKDDIAQIDADAPVTANGSAGLTKRAKPDTVASEGGLSVKACIISTAIIAVSLIFGSYMIGGRYVAYHSGSDDLSNGFIRLDRYTGALSFCAIVAEKANQPGSLECFPVPDAKMAHQAIRRHFKIQTDTLLTRCKGESVSVTRAVLIICASLMGCSNHTEKNRHLTQQERRPTTQSCS